MREVRGMAASEVTSGTLRPAAAAGGSRSLTTEQPWIRLPRSLGELLADSVPALVEEIVRRIPQEVPEYARPLEGDFGAAVRRGVQVALSRLFVDLPGRDEPALKADTRVVYRQLGIGEARAGRSLEALLSAYRLGARVTFRAASAAAERGGLEPGLRSRSASRSSFTSTRSPPPASRASPTSSPVRSVSGTAAARPCCAGC